VIVNVEFLNVDVINIVEDIVVMDMIATKN
jgi:hypothetical protein